MTSHHEDDDITTASADSFSNENVDVTKAPAFVSWLDDDGQLQLLSHSPSTHDHITFDLKFDAESGTALFKVTANVSLKGKRNKSNVFVFIYPENIQNLAIVNTSGDSYISATDTFGTPISSLHFTLSTPAVLVVPGDDCVPKNEATRFTLFLLQDLVERYSFNVAFPAQTLSNDLLATVCHEVSSQRRIATMPGLANMSKLYGGKGGRIMRRGDKLGSESKSPVKANPHGLDTATQLSVATGSGKKDEPSKKPDPEQSGQDDVVFSPPSYDELDGDCSLPDYPRSGSKRKRVGSNGSQIAGNENLRLEELIQRGFSDIGSRLDRIEQSLGTLGSRLEQAEERMSAIESQLSQSRSSEQKDGQSSDLTKRIDGVEERVDDVEHKLDAGLSELANDIENQMYDVRNEFENTISVRVGDEMGVAQSELEDFVKDEMINCAEEIERAVRDRFRDALG